MVAIIIYFLSLCNLSCVKSLQKYFFKIHKYTSHLKKSLFNSSRVFENQHNETCSHLSEKASKGRFLKPEKIQNHSNEGKGKEKKKERREGKKEKKQKSKGCTLSFYNSYFGDSFWPKKKNCWMQKANMAIPLSKIRLELYYPHWLPHRLSRRQSLGGLSTRRSWYHWRHPEVFLQHDSHCACEDVLEWRSHTSKREFSGWN